MIFTTIKLLFFCFLLSASSYSFANIGIDNFSKFGNNFFKSDNLIIVTHTRDRDRNYILSISKDNGKKWKDIQFADKRRITNVFISTDSKIYAFAYTYVGGDAIGVLYESVDSGDSWRELRRFTRDFPCQYEWSDSLVVTNDRVYCAYNYTSKYDSSDGNHNVILKGKLANLIFKNENEGAALTSDGFYTTEDAGYSWAFKGLWPDSSPFKEPRFNDEKHPLLYGNEFVRYVSNQKIIYITDGVLGHHKYHVEQMLFSNGFFISDYKKDFDCKSCSLKDMKFIKMGDYMYFLSIENNVFATKDGGMSWVTTSRIMPWHEMCYVSGDYSDINASINCNH